MKIRAEEISKVGKNKTTFICDSCFILNTFFWKLLLPNFKYDHFQVGVFISGLIAISISLLASPYWACSDFYCFLNKTHSQQIFLKNSLTGSQHLFKRLHSHKYLQRQPYLTSKTIPVINAARNKSPPNTDHPTIVSRFEYEVI